MERKNSRVNMISVNTQGIKMRIIAYRKCSDIDVQFEDGAIVRHKQYDAFIKGMIKHPSDKTKQISRVGEIAINSQGLRMCIVKYNNASDIAVRFEDGTTVDNKTYWNFRAGLVRNPNYRGGQR